MSFIKKKEIKDTFKNSLLMYYHLHIPKQIYSRISLVFIIYSMILCYKNASLNWFSCHWSFKYKNITVYYICYFDEIKFKIKTQNNISHLRSYSFQRTCKLPHDQVLEQAFFRILDLNILKQNYGFNIYYVFSYLLCII